MSNARQKNLRLTPDRRLLLDALRQYLLLPSDTEAGALSIITMGEQLLASYLASGMHPSRCDMLLGALNAASGSALPPYKIDDTRRLLRWHSPTSTYQYIQASAAPWIPLV